MEKANRLRPILQKFSDRYMHYSTALSELNPRYFIDICFETAEALFYILTSVKSQKLELSFDIITSLNEGNVVIGYLDGDDESHSFSLVKESDTIYLVHSLGGIFAAYIKEFSSKEFKILWSEFEKSHDTSILFDFLNKRNTFTISSKSAKLSKLENIVMPTFDEEKFDKFRINYLNEFVSHSFDQNYLLFRKSDIEKYLKESAYNSK